MKKIISLIMALIMLASVLTGCSGNEEAVSETTGTNKDSIMIGMSFDSFVIERWQRDRDIFVATAKELGADVNVQAANGEIEEQISQIEYFINKGVDVIVVVAIDADMLSPVVYKAKKAGIPVLCYDRLICDADADLYVSFDNEKVGELMGQALYRKIGKGKRVLEVCGPSADKNVEQVANGFARETEENSGRIIDTCHCDGWKSEEAYEYISNNEELVKSVDGIMCGNDSLAGAVIRALSEMRLAGKIAVVGQDADLEGCQRIVEGTQEMTVYKPVENLARAAAEYAVMLAKKEPIEAKETYNDGAFDIPYIKLQPVPVNRNNMDETIIGGGYHLKEDVYMNVRDME